MERRRRTSPRDESTWALPARPDGEASEAGSSRLADTAKGNRPSFTDAARPEDARPIYERVCAGLERAGVRVERGVFGARMQVELVNDGPVTIVLDL